MKLFEEYCKERGIKQNMDSLLMMMWEKDWLNTSKIRKDLQHEEEDSLDNSKTDWLVIIHRCSMACNYRADDAQKSGVRIMKTVIDEIMDELYKLRIKQIDAYHALNIAINDLNEIVHSLEDLKSRINQLNEN